MVKLGIDRRCFDAKGNQLHRGDKVLVLRTNKEAVVSDFNTDSVWLDDERWSFNNNELIKKTVRVVMG